MTYFRHTASGPGQAGDVWTVTMHTQGTALIQAVHDSWTSAVTSFWTAGLGPMCTVDQQLTETVTSSLDPITSANTAQARTPLSLKGALSAEPTTPQSVCIVTGLRTALPTRRGRGRMYWPGPAGSQLTNEGLIPSDKQIDLAADLAIALSTLAAISQPVIYHLNGALPPTSTPITHVTVGRVPGTQRRRVNKVAESYALSNL